MSIKTGETEDQPEEASLVRNTPTAIYARTASCSQTSSSIHDQMTSCSAEALARGLAVVHVYSDPGCSGTSHTERAGLAALMIAAKRGEFNVVVVSDSERIGRTAATFAIVHGILTDLGITLISVADGILDAQWRNEELVCREIADVRKTYHINRHH